MQTFRTIGFCLLSTFLFIACASSPDIPNRDNNIHVTILHMNDVYEITPVSGGKAGGLARVATLKKQLEAQNPNTITVIGGDFFSPSAMGTAKINGERLAGKQMVSVMNALGLQYATFGNHEFDISRKAFYQRMEESKYTWVSSNVFDEKGNAIPDVKKNHLLTFKNKNNTFTIGLFGLTLDSNKADYVSYRDAATIGAEQTQLLANKSDFVIGLTHQAITDDVRLIEANPKLDLVLGGHEHENYQRWRGDFAPVLKADANVRSVYVVDIYFDPATKKSDINARLVPITDEIHDDPDVKKIVDGWRTKVFEAFRKEGLNPEEEVTMLSKSLDGLEASVRTKSTGMTQLIAQSMLRPYPNTDLSLFNGGSVRIDDVLPPGKLSVYDVIRMLPFGGSVALIKVKGSLLEKTLIQGQKNLGSGGFLQSANTTFNQNTWFVNDKTIEHQKDYTIAISDFLLSGKETGLAYLTPDNPDISILEKGNSLDIRQLVIEQLKSGNY